MPNGSPREFTCLLPVYAGDDANAFAQAFQSVVHATLQPRVVFICQDGDVGGLLGEVIARCAGRTDVKIFRNPGERGLHHNLNYAARQVQTPWICRADADDVNALDRFEVQAHFLETHPEISVVGSDIEEFWPDGRTRLKTMPGTDTAIRRLCVYRNPINHMTAFFRTAAFEEAGGYPSIALKEDYALWLAMIANGRQLANIAKPLVRVRLGDDFYKRRRGRGQLASEMRLFAYRRAVPGVGIYQAAVASGARALLLSSRWTAERIYEGFLR